MIKRFLDFLRDYQRLFKLIPSLLVICCFINTLGYEYVYDDLFHVVKAKSALGSWDLANLKRMLTTDFWSFITYYYPENEHLKSAYYRPFLVFFLKINYWYAGLDGWKWHITGILLHSVAAGLVYNLVIATIEEFDKNKNEFQNSFIALIAASVFAVHPVQSESIAWISAHANALLAILIFSSLLAYLKARKTLGKSFVGWLLLSTFFYILAALTKEVALLLPVILFSYEIFLFDREKPIVERLKEDFICGLPFFIATISYLIIRLKILGYIGVVVEKTIEFPNFTGVSFSVSLFTLPMILLSYLKNIVLPFSLSLFYPVYYTSKLELTNFYLPLLILTIIGLVLLVIMYRNLVTRLAFIWFLVPLLPVLNIRSFRPEELIHDRYLYFSLIGAGIFLGQLILWLNKLLAKDKQVGESQSENKKTLLEPALIVVVVLFLVLLVSTTIRQNDVWANELQLWSSVQERFPTSCIANKELGRLLITSGNYSQATICFEQAKQSCPDSLPVHEALGFLYLNSGDISKAELEVRRLLELVPNSFITASAYSNLGFIYETKKDKTQAAQFYQKALEINPSLDTAKDGLHRLEKQK